MLALLACASVARAQQTASGAIDSIRCGPFNETDISRDDAQNPAQDHFTFKEHRSTFHNHNNEAVTTIQTAIAEAPMASLEIAHVNYDVQDYETFHLNMERRRAEQMAENNGWGWQPPG